MRLFMIVVAALLLAACGRNRPEMRPDPPPAPVIVEVPVAHYVPVPDDLLARCSWRKTAPLEVMPAVARERKRCLELYEADREAIRKIRGKPAPTTDPRND